jgi:hypothetical protein
MGKNRILEERMKTLACLLMTAALLVGAAEAAKPEGKGQGGKPASAGAPHGQTVSGCNHQANELDLKGQERKAFVDRCIAAGGDARSPEESGRHCRRKADDLSLKGDLRRDFLDLCRSYRDGDRDWRR